MISVAADSVSDSMTQRTFTPYFLSDWLNGALEKSGLSQSGLADALNQQLPKTINRSTVNKMSLGTRTISAEEMLVIAEVTGAQLPSERSTEEAIQIVGSVTSGSRVSPSDPEGSSDLGQAIADAISSLIAEKGTNPRAVALAAGMGPTSVRDIITRKAKNPAYATLLKIANVLNVELSQIVGSPNSLNREASDMSLAGQVACPPGISPKNLVAVIIGGDSMEPVYSEGDVLFFERIGDSVPHEAIDQKCLCEDSDGNTWVKQVRAGSEPDLYHLIAISPFSSNQLNTKVKWAARLRLHWPAYLVKHL